MIFFFVLFTVNSILIQIMLFKNSPIHYNANKHVSIPNLNPQIVKDFVSNCIYITTFKQNKLQQTMQNISKTFSLNIHTTCKEFTRYTNNNFTKCTFSENYASPLETKEKELFNNEF